MQTLRLEESQRGAGSDEVFGRARNLWEYHAGLKRGPLTAAAGCTLLGTAKYSGRMNGGLRGTAPTPLEQLSCMYNFVFDNALYILIFIHKCRWFVYIFTPWDYSLEETEKSKKNRRIG